MNSKSPIHEGAPYKRYPSGDFSVDPDECMGCGAPPIEAPDLMEFAKSSEGYWQCRFVRQPQNQEEKNQACRGGWASCCGAAAYRGKDRRIIERIAILNANKGQFAESLTVDRVAPFVTEHSTQAQRPILSTPKPGFLESLLKRLK
jgi:Fe-S-cluster-containing dehydrogenase component